MEMNARCIACLIKKQDEKIRKESDEKKETILYERSFAYLRKQQG